MSYDLHDGTVHAWATNPTPATTWRQRLTQWIGLDRQTSTGGKHRATPDREQADADYNPLQPADRMRMAPTYWADPDRHLPAPEGERTGRMDTGAVLNLAKPAEPEPADRDQVLAEMRGALSDPAAAIVADIFATHARPTDTTGEKDQ